MKYTFCEGCLIRFFPLGERQKTFCIDCRKERRLALNRPITAAWIRANWERANLYSKNHRYRYYKTNGKYTINEWNELKALYNYMCVGCGCKEPAIKLTADHKIPISKGGSNFIDNIQPLCKKCNSFKHTKIWFAQCRWIPSFKAFSIPMKPVYY